MEFSYSLNIYIYFYMKYMFKKSFIIFGFFFFMGNSVYSAEVATQVLSTSLGQVLELSKVIVETTEHNVDMPLLDVKKKSKTSISPDINQVSLSPMAVKIHTNLTTPISVTAEFLELNHTLGKYTFSPSDLSFSPNNQTINNPFDEIISEEFIPQLNVRKESATGIYTGKVRFTIGAI